MSEEPFLFEFTPQEKLEFYLNHSKIGHNDHLLYVKNGHIIQKKQRLDHEISVYQNLLTQIRAKKPRLNHATDLTPEYFKPEDLNVMLEQQKIKLEVCKKKTASFTCITIREENIQRRIQVLETCAQGVREVDDNTLENLNVILKELKEKLDYVLDEYTPVLHHDDGYNFALNKSLKKETKELFLSELLNPQIKDKNQYENILQIVVDLNRNSAIGRRSLLLDEIWMLLQMREGGHLHISKDDLKSIYRNKFRKELCDEKTLIDDRIALLWNEYENETNSTKEIIDEKSMNEIEKAYEMRKLYPMGDKRKQFFEYIVDEKEKISVLETIYKGYSNICLHDHALFSQIYAWPKFSSDADAAINARAEVLKKVKGGCMVPGQRS